jgi:protein-S-isoprenylcysteine O-methyltransferase Ste14
MTVTPRMAILTLAGTSAYIGLAVLGWGGLGAFFSHLPLLIVAVATCALAVLGLFTQANLRRGEREDRSNRWVLIAFGVLGLLGGYLPAYTDRLDFWTLDGDAVRWLGVVLFLAGGALRMWPVFVLGSRFSGLVAIQPGHTLVTRGIYGTGRSWLCR